MSGKKYKEKTKLVEAGKFYSYQDAIKLVKETAPAKFDESIDLALKLGVDPKKDAGSVRGSLNLPGGSGKSKKVAVLAQGEKVAEAEKAGADFVGGEDLAKKIQGGFFGFDVLIATPDMMPTVGKLGRILGPKGLMPNPKTGTVTAEVEKTVKEYKAGKIEYRMDKSGIVHLILGKVSFAEDKLLKNFTTILSAIIRAKPKGVKGAYIESITLSSSMGPGIKVNSRKTVDEMEEIL